MESSFKPIFNTERIGSTVDIELPGFESDRGTKKEKCKIHYLVYGQGEPLLLVHSIGQSMYTWRNLMPILARYYTVIAFDLVGSGFSGRPFSMNYSMDEVADSILMFMDAINLKQTHILGFSMGALYALCAVEKAKERFFKIMTLLPGGVTAAMPKKIRAMHTSPFGALVRESYSKKHIEKWLRECYYDGTAVSKETVEQYLETVDDFSSRQAIMYSLRNFDKDLALQFAKRIENEVLVLWATDDRWRPLQDMDELKDYLNHGVYHSVRNGGHLVHEEKAELIAEILDKYLLYNGSGQ